MKYINADRLRADIEKRLKNTRDYMNGAGMKYKGAKYFKAQGKESAYDALLNVIDSLQQEQLDIDKIKREWHNKGYLEGRKNAHIPARELGLPKSWDFQQDQPEMDIEKEIQLYIESIGFGHGGWVDGLSDEDLRNIARYFFNLGLNARK